MEIPDQKGTHTALKEAHANMRRDLGSARTLVNRSAASENAETYRRKCPARPKTFIHILR
jgi:hypothetical protein